MKYLSYNTKGVSKNYLILINSQKLIHMIISERGYFIMKKLLFRNCEVNMTDFSFNKRNIN